MQARIERRLLQITVAVACLVPLLAGGAGIIEGAAFVARRVPATAALDSHFRYLSGLLLGIGIAFVLLIPAIERRSRPFAMLSAIVVIGGLGRLYGVLVEGSPGASHIFGLAMELAVVPLLFLWQRRVARRCARSG